MKYLSAKEAAARWGVTPRYVQKLAADGRVPGAMKRGGAYRIPSDAQKPSDPRRVKKDGGEPQAEYALIPALHLHGGDLAGAFDRCQSEDERALLDADLAYLRGDAEAARSLAAALYRGTGEPQLKIGAGMILCLCALCLGDASAWKQTFAELAALRVPARLEQERAFALGALNVWLHGVSFPAWLETGAFTGLSPALFPLARWIYAFILYIKWREVDLLAVAEPFIAECRRERSDLCEAYLRLIAATAYFDHGRREQAAAHIRAAADLLLPLGLTAPFVEYRLILPGVMDACLQERYPAALRDIKRRTQPFTAHWAAVYEGVLGRPAPGGLSQREFEVCLLTQRGMTAGEIAVRIGVSKNTVKKYLRAAFDKLGAEGREQLGVYLHP